MSEIATDFWAVLEAMSPYLLFGFLIAGVLSVMISQQLVARHLGGRGLMPVIKSALLGVPLPLCSCGVIPVGASLKRHGASKGATTAFLISTPQTGVDSILVTFSLLGGVFAVFRPLFALLSGVLGGALVEAFTREAHAPVEKLPPCTQPCCSKDGGSKIRRMLSYGLLTLPGEIGWALLIGLLIAAMVSALVPPDFFAPLLGGGLGAMVLMMLMGIPIYVCATASVPVAAALITTGGVSPGAAFAFLMTGPATNAATIATIWKVMGKKTAVIYLATMAVAAIVGGLILDRIVTVQDVRAAGAMSWMLPPVVRTGSAVALLAMLVWAVLRPLFGQRAAPVEPAGAESAVLKVSGMTCSHCADTVREALLEGEGVQAVSVDLKAGRAIVTGNGLNLEDLRQAVEAIGYEVEKGSSAEKRTLKHSTPETPRPKPGEDV